MKVLEFRAWEKSLEEMIIVDNIDFTSSMINTKGGWRYFTEVDLMQHIGSRDSSGQLIYEGDYIKVIEQINGNYVQNVYYEFEVVWVRNGWFLKDRKKNVQCYRTLSHWENAEIRVIGNKYEGINQPW